MTVLLVVLAAAAGAAAMWLHERRHYAELREDRNGWEAQALTRYTAAENLADQLVAAQRPRKRVVRRPIQRLS